MSTVKQHQPTPRFAPNVGPRTHALFSYPLLVSWIDLLMPSLATPDPKNLRVLDNIYTYLFSAVSAKAEALENEVNETLYGCLLGLKTILLAYDNNWQHAMLCLNEHRKLPPVRKLRHRGTRG